MSVPAILMPPDIQVRGDTWTLRLNLDPAKNWSTSTFTIDTSDIGTYQVVIDDSNKGASPPYIELSLSKLATTNIVPINVRWNLSENNVMGRTFLTGNVMLTDR